MTMKDLIVPESLKKKAKSYVESYFLTHRIVLVLYPQITIF